MKPHLLILGVHRKIAAYPNVLFRVNDLLASNKFHTTEINHPLPQGKNILITGLIGIWQHIRCLFSLLKQPQTDKLYLPYPGVFLAWLITWLLPQKRQPRQIYLDAFISLYDTVVNDRNMLGRKHPLARILKYIEKITFAHCTKVIVDTQGNQKFMADLFQLPQTQFQPIHLHTDEVHFQPTLYQVKTDSSIEVLFIGTLIPLHGIPIILQAIKQLKDRPDIHFTLIGDGQESGKIAAYQPRFSNLTWIQEWQNSAQLAKFIQASDICLGIFSPNDKTQRVLPYKNYAYARVGRAIITAQTQWTEHHLNNESAFYVVPPNNPTALSNSIDILANNIQLRGQYAQASQDYYQNHLTNQQAYQSLFQSLTLADS